MLSKLIWRIEIILRITGNPLSYLVGGWTNASEKYDFVYWDDYSIPKSYGKISQSCSKAPTSYGGQLSLCQRSPKANHCFMGSLL